MPDLVRIGIVTVSDRAFQGLYADLGGPAVQAVLNDFLLSPWQGYFVCVPDEREQITEVLITLCERERCSLVLTTGGTGPALRDVTPEATESICDRLMPGFGEQMRLASLEQIPTAILSRQVAGLRGSSLIVNLPGRPESIRLCLSAVFPAIPWCLELMGAPRLVTNPEHCKAFYPAG
jgi:molybdopterin adenylyltransferase